MEICPVLSINKVFQFSVILLHFVLLSFFSELSTRFVLEMMRHEFEDQRGFTFAKHQIGISNQCRPRQGRMAKVKQSRRRRKMKVAVGDGALRKRKLTETQADMLERCFGTERKLESERKDRLAAELGLEPRQVAVWFQNRRARWRSKRMEEEVAPLRLQNETAVVENCRLENEILKLKEQLMEAEREIQKLSIRSNENNSIHCLPMNASEVSPFLEGFGLVEGFEDVHYLEQLYHCVPGLSVHESVLF